MAKLRKLDETVPPGQFKTASIAVVATGTRRVLMIQRDDEDPAKQSAGLWEFPGGRLDAGEDPWEAAKREWQEETGNLFPGKARLTGHWDSGQRRVYIVFIDHESDVNLNPDRADMMAVDPDHPNARRAEISAWWLIRSAEGAAPAMRAELRDFPWDQL